MQLRYFCYSTSVLSSFFFSFLFIFSFLGGQEGQRFGLIFTSDFVNVDFNYLNSCHIHEYCRQLLKKVLSLVVDVVF